MSRKFEMSRESKETSIKMCFCADGSGHSQIDTGVGFLDHMLELFAKHGIFDLILSCKGDIHVDEHHTVEDIGIVLGKCIKEALGEKASIKRYGSFILPMDEVLALVAVDVGGRPFFAYDVEFSTQRIGGMNCEMIEEFFRAVAVNAGMNLHIKLLSGGNSHHICEAVFKAFAKALYEAVTIDTRIEGVLSTKGILD